MPKKSCYGRPDLIAFSGYNVKTMKTTSLPVVLAASLLAFSSAAPAAIIFNNIPDTLPANVASLAYNATSTSELGNSVTFAGTERELTNVRITLSNWATQDDNPDFGDASGYDHPVIVNIYEAIDAITVGSLIATRTQTVHIPWHVAGGEEGGTAFNVDFDFTGTSVPDSAIFAVAYNTQNRGPSPIGAAGPYDFLNYGVIADSPSVGTDIDPDNVFWSSTYLGRPDGLSNDQGWTGITPMVQVTAVAVPEPSHALLLVLTGSLTILRRRRD